MKPGLVSAALVAVLLLAALAFWRTGMPGSAAPKGQVGAVAPTPEPVAVLSGGEPGPGGMDRSVAAPAPVAPPAPEGGPAAPLAVAGSLESAVGRKRDPEAGDAGNAAFEGKYAGMGAEDRREALEFLRMRLERSGNGGSDKGRALTEEELREIKREIEWLLANGAR